MAPQIRPTRLDVTDRFPMVAFKIRADGASSQAEVAIGADPTLFTPEARRTVPPPISIRRAATARVRFTGGEASYILPPEVLARFIGNEKLYFGLATAAEGGAMKVAVSPTAASPYICIKGLTGRSLARVRMLPNRQQRAAGYGRNGQAQLEWAGRHRGARHGAGRQRRRRAGEERQDQRRRAAPAAPYDDGFGPMPGRRRRPTAPAPTAQGLGRRYSRGLDYAADDPEARGIEGPAYSEAVALSRPQARGLSVPTPIIRALRASRPPQPSMPAVAARRSTASSSTSPMRRRRPARSTTSTGRGPGAPTISSARTGR